jgi:hypothetical protein
VSHSGELVTVEEDFEFGKDCFGLDQSRPGRRIALVS